MRYGAPEIYVSVRLNPNSIRDAPSVGETSALLFPEAGQSGFDGALTTTPYYLPQLMQRSIGFLFLAAMVSFTGCKSSEPPKEASQMDEPAAPAYVELASERFGKNAEFVENPTGEYVLVVSRTEPSAQNPQPTVSFFVYGKTESDVTYESEVIGSVTWLDDYYLEVVVIPGIVKANAEPGGVIYRVDARSGSRVEMKAPSRR